MRRFQNFKHVNRVLVQPHYILGQVGIMKHPQRGGIHVVNMPLHEFGK